MLGAEVGKMITEYEEYLKTWIFGFLSTAQPILNGFPPCPYARKALLDNKIKFVRSEDYTQDVINETTNWTDEFDVVVFVCPDTVSKEQFVTDVEYINSVIMPTGFVVLEDHIDIPEPLGEVDFRNGKYNLILAQRIDKINDASLKLKEKGYYKNWSEDDISAVVAWRFI
jgi:hypothetical protein